ncbi:hypothetical protein KO489_10530 [Reinekea forsetii]|nr:hypothetical protein [Reinekea forsetii]
MNHFNAEELLGFLDDPKNPSQQVLRTHLVDCAQCRNKLAQLKAMPTQLLESQMHLASCQGLTDEDALLIAAYVEKRLDTAEHQKIEQRIKHDAQWQKAALHYAMHSTQVNALESIQHTAAVTSSKKSQHKNKKSWFEKIRNSLDSWQAPIWQPIAATFIVTFAVGLFVINDAQNKTTDATDAPQLVQFQSDEGLFWQQPTPGLGFFHSANAERAPYAGVYIQLDALQLNAQWPAIEGVEIYQFRITHFTQGAIHTIADQQIADTELTLPASLFSSGKAYEWVLSGLANDGRQFQTSGGFVVSNIDAVKSSSE